MDRIRLIYMVFLFTVVTSDDENGEVSFSGTTVTLGCPFLSESQDNYEWQKDGVTMTDKGARYHTIYNYDEKNDGLYYCKLDKKKYFFYIKAVVCTDCVELDAALIIGVLIADIMITLGIVLMVYLCARKKAGTAPPQRGNQQHQANRAPIPPNPDYQTLNQATRGNAVYAEAKRR